MPDLAESLSQYKDNDDFVLLLANPHNDAEETLEVLAKYELTIPTLLDSDKSIYTSYDRSQEGFAPYPLHVIIDGAGVIRYLSYQVDMIAVTATLDAVLAE